MLQGGAGGAAQDDVLHRHHLHTLTGQEHPSVGEED